jgi:hypothetical protein
MIRTVEYLFDRIMQQPNESLVFIRIFELEHSSNNRKEIFDYTLFTKFKQLRRNLSETVSFLYIQNPVFPSTVWRLLLQLLSASLRVGVCVCVRHTIIKHE